MVSHCDLSLTNPPSTFRVAPSPHIIAQNLGTRTHPPFPEMPGHIIGVHTLQDFGNALPFSMRNACIHPDPNQAKAGRRFPKLNAVSGWHRLVRQHGHLKTGCLGSQLLEKRGAVKSLADSFMPGCISTDVPFQAWSSARIRTGWPFRLPTTDAHDHMPKHNNINHLSIMANEHSSP